ncbi:MAG: M23 family metallopeptidase [Pseudomonadota bacterium]
MSLGTAILQPQALRRGKVDPSVALIEDLMRLGMLIAEDAAQEGPIVAECEVAFQDWGQAFLASFTTRRQAVEQRLRAKISGPRTALAALMTDMEALDDDPQKIIPLLRKLFLLLDGLTKSATLPVLRRELTFLKALVEEDLGLSPAAIGNAIAEYATTLRRRLVHLPAPDNAQTRRRILMARAILGRLVLKNDQLRPPGIDIEPLARLLHRLLTKSGVAKALKDVGCALDGAEKALNAALAAGKAATTAAQSLSAASALPAGVAEYSYYGSWLLRDVEVPLLGYDEVNDKPGFLGLIRAESNGLAAAIKASLDETTRNEVDALTGGQEPSKDLMMRVLATINKTSQERPILHSETGTLVVGEEEMTPYLRKLMREHVKNQELMLLNRRALEQFFHSRVEVMSDVGWRVIGDFFLDAFHWPRNQVIVTSDRRFVLCDDKPMLFGTDLKWHQAPMFSTSADGLMWFDFKHFGRDGMEIWTFVWSILAEFAKSVWHLATIQPGHEGQGAMVGAIEIVDWLQTCVFRKPISGHFLELGRHARNYGKSLDSFWGLKGMSTFGWSFQSLQTEKPNETTFPDWEDERFLFWITVIMGDIFRTAGPISTCNSLRDILIEIPTLINFQGPGSPHSSLPRNPAWNNRKQTALVGLSHSLFAMLLISLYPRDNYSIFIFAEDNIGDRQAAAFAGHHLGGSAGMGFLGGFLGSFVAQFLAGSGDVGKIFASGGWSALKMYLLYWIYMYLFKENDTDDGRYRPNGGSLNGYPDKDAAPSPYRLPFPANTEQYTGQGNLGLFSHNYITNTSFDPGFLNAVQQAYAYDFGHDFRVPIACVRDGEVHSFAEGFADSNTADWNFLIIKHDGIDPVHDKFDSGPAIQTYSVYGHLARNGVQDADKWGGTPPNVGDQVRRGELICLAGDTGMSFHNHLHLHVLPDDGTGNNPVDVTAAGQFFSTVPFVFDDAPGDGVLKSTTWYRSRNVAPT